MFRTLFILALFLPAPAIAETIAGPVLATVERVIDGDTLLVHAAVWPGTIVRVAVRVRGIDAPEIRSKCPSERAAAERSREALVSLIGERPVEITAISGGKYFGRVVADVATEGGSPVAETMLAAGHASAYGGGRRIAVSC